MKQRVVAVLILLLTFALVYLIYFLSDHDSVVEVLDVNHVQLKGGRSVYLIGVAGTGIETDTLDVTEDTTNLEPGNMAYADREQVLDILNDITRKVNGQEVELEYEGSFEPDSADVALHAYVHLKDGTDLGAWLLENGLAEVETEQKHPRKEQYLLLERRARDNGLGIWAAPADSTMEAAPAGM